MHRLFKTLSRLVMVASILAPHAASAAESVSIPFADLGAIRDWHAENAEVLYVESRNRRWYRITFQTPCLQLPFATGIAFVTDEIGALDKYGSILVNGERCYFRTFQQSEPPAEQRDADSSD